MYKDSQWRMISKGFNSEQESLREAIYTLGNGYFGTRGASSEAVASENHYPGTYMAGVYNRLPTRIAGKTIYNEDFVNCPDWTFLTFKIGDGEWFLPASENIISYRQQLDFRKGLLSWYMKVQNHQGQITLIQTHRLVHMRYPHLGAISYTIIPQNYSDWVTLYSALNGDIINYGVERYRQLNSKHLQFIDSGVAKGRDLYLLMQTSQSKIKIAQASRLQLFAGDKRKTVSSKIIGKGTNKVGRQVRFFARYHNSYTAQKLAAIYTSKDKFVKNPLASAKKAVTKRVSFNQLVKTQQKAWREIWHNFDIKVEGDFFTQKVLRLHIFHLLQTVSGNNCNIDAGMPARGLHGEAYRGHIFWDEIFTIPVYSLHWPEVAKALLMYRYRRLPAARQYAAESGYRGAMFPWQSGSSGREESQVLHLNPLSGKWGKDHSCLQRHISYSIAYNIWYYFYTSCDQSFINNYGAELMLSIAQFASSLVKFSSKDQRYHTQGLMGPDEFHEKYPGAKGAGFKDNAYTNIMIVWTLMRAQDLIKSLPPSVKQRLFNKLGITTRELKRWQDITRRMNIIFNEDRIISQFKGYFNLKEINWERYKKKYKKIGRMDRILKAEGKSPDRYKVAKQADVLMAFYLIPYNQIKGIFSRLGYKFTKRDLRKNFNYYLRRTSHGSTLSKVVHSLLALELGLKKKGWHFFREVLESDIYDVQGGTTPEGIHTGAMGGSIDILLRGWMGLELKEDTIKINPSFTKDWKLVKFKMFFRECCYLFVVSSKKIEVSLLSVGQAPLPIEYHGHQHKFSYKKRSLSFRR
jgi:trehalose/maltose hydrolase-like predicted phosphorylase